MILNLLIHILDFHDLQVDLNSDWKKKIYFFLAKEEDFWKHSKEPPILINLVVAVATGVPKAIYGYATGKDLIDGHTLSSAEHALNLLEVVPVTLIGTKVLKGIKSIKVGQKVLDLGASAFNKSKEEVKRLAGKIALSGAEIIARRQAWLTNLQQKFGTLDFISFTPKGIKPESVPITIYNEMLNGYSSTLNLQMKKEYLNLLIKSGRDVPIKVTLNQADELYKIVPKGNLPGKSSYYLSKTEYEMLKNSPELEQKLGLPLGSHSVEYDVYKAVANQSVDVFESAVAKTVQRGYETSGGAIQTLILDTDKWTLSKLETITPSK
jgi:hypothetical protein